MLVSNSGQVARFLDPEAGIVSREEVLAAGKPGERSASPDPPVHRNRSTSVGCVLILLVEQDGPNLRRGRSGRRPTSSRSIRTPEEGVGGSLLSYCTGTEYPPSMRGHGTPTRSEESRHERSWND